jgi:hypothetical protein
MQQRSLCGKNDNSTVLPVLLFPSIPSLSAFQGGPFKRSIEMASCVGGEVVLYLLVSHISQRAFGVQGETIGAYLVTDAGSQVE